ncbi:hypothetical protein EPA93_40490 [Ktedonosporobacter rubrisoli]|uniref:Uncharacterized protein n=1 Tax=Ktedonosporobacter rubrisoli TaxID=2509675 RepID=A0A4P6K1G7_KTERU|nr:hypothetical protein [Ktedonosporobacter rubrisoli]QBD81924.1 hypothetical protein EPA93_40490 [Ktedonosporobacter rubrisoli]
MTIAQTFFAGYSPLAQTRLNVEGIAQLGVRAIFRASPRATTRDILGQLERRDRIVLMLLDGKRTIQDVARLVHRNELEIARTLVHLLECGYVEFLGSEGQVPQS